MRAIELPVRLPAVMDYRAFALHQDPMGLHGFHPTFGMDTVPGVCRRHNRIQPITANAVLPLPVVPIHRRLQRKPHANRLQWRQPSVVAVGWPGLPRLPRCVEISSRNKSHINSDARANGSSCPWVRWTANARRLGPYCIASLASGGKSLRWTSPQGQRVSIAQYSVT